MERTPHPRVRDLGRVTASSASQAQTRRFQRHDKSRVSPYRLVAQSAARGGCARNNRLLRRMNTPTAQSIAGVSPSGSVTITEDFGGGTGTLEYQGRSYPFKVLGTVAGPGGGVEKITASGPVYKLASVTEFPGRYTQSTGKAGFSSSGSSDLWLENSTGVIMHLEGTSSGAMLTLGKDEIFIRMAQ